MGEVQPNSVRLKNIVSSPQLMEYILNVSAFPKEHPQLKELRDSTRNKYGKLSRMNVPVDEAQFLSLLLKLMNAKNTLEIGVFTGYSLFTTALALPDDGKVTGIDLDREAYETGLPHMRKAGVDHKIDFIEGNALSVLSDLLSNGKEGTFDFAFVDAEKSDYPKYHELLMKLVKVGGVVGYDNTLWYGSVAFPNDDEYFKGDGPARKAFRDRTRDDVRKFNELLASDPQVESIILSIGDGLSICRRK